MSSTQTITCPFCAEEIKETAIKCRYCGEYLVDPAEVIPVQPPRRGTGDLSQRVPTAGPARGSGRLRQPAFPPSPLPDWATKKNLLVGGGVVTVIGLLVAPKFTLLFLALGMPSLWVLFDSTWRYEKPSWAEAALGPIVLPLLYYLVKRTFTKPEIVRPTGKRPDGLPNVAYPPGRQLLATLSMLVLLIGLMSRGASERPQVARQEAVEKPTQVQAAHPGQKAPTPEHPAAPAEKQEDLNWNKSDLDALSNGNIDTAMEMMNRLKPGAISGMAVSVAPALVMKAPWKYYGKMLRFSGDAEVVQDYPPDSDVGQRFGGEAAEIVFQDADGTIVDFFLMGNSGSIKAGSSVTVYGTPVGQAEADNQLGGKSSHLVMVGKLVK